MLALLLVARAEGVFVTYPGLLAGAAVTSSSRLIDISVIWAARVEHPGLAAYCVAELLRKELDHGVTVERLPASLPEPA